MGVQDQFIGRTPLEEWRKGREGSFFISPASEPVRVFLSDGTEHVYPQYSYEIRNRSTDGGHGYAVGPAGELQVVEFSSTILRGSDKHTEIAADIKVAVTYSPSTWQRVTGPTEKAPETPTREVKPLYKR